MTDLRAKHSAHLQRRHSRLAKNSLLFQFDPLPGRIPQDKVEATVLPNIRELQRPMEEAFALAQLQSLRKGCIQAALSCSVASARLSVHHFILFQPFRIALEEGIREGSQTTPSTIPVALVCRVSFICSAGG